MVFLPPGPQFRQTRKYFHQTLGRAGTERFDPIIEEEMAKLLERLIDVQAGSDPSIEIRQ